MSTIHFTKVEITKDSPRFFVIFDKFNKKNPTFKVMNLSQFNNFLIVSVLQNKDVTNFTVIDLLRPLSYAQGFEIAKCAGFVSEFALDFHSALRGLTHITTSEVDSAVRVALTEWDIL